MKMVFCLMGYPCNGKYEAFKYLHSYYHLHPIKSYTNKKKQRNEPFDIFHYVSMNKMLELEQANDIIDLRTVGKIHIGKQKTTIPEGLSVCISDYNEYKELSEIVYTVPILIHKDMKKRYYETPECKAMTPNEFLMYEDLNKTQFNEAKKDPNIIQVTASDWLELLLILDDIIQPYITEIKYLNERSNK